MPVTKEEIQSFQQFAFEKIANGGADSLWDLVAQWESHREYDQSVAAIRESMADADAGQLIPASEAFAQARERLGLDQ